MLLVVMCLMVAMTFSIALLGVVTSEMVPTAHQTKAARTIQAAQTGLQAAASGLRAAISATPEAGITGDVTKLPCWSTAAPLVGTVGGGSGATSALTWTVTVSYFSVDPSAQSASWRASNALPCTAGAGPSGVPLYALVTASATGVGGAGMSSSFGNRSVEMVYSLSGTDVGTLGGQIHTNVAESLPDLCWTAPSSWPAAGAGLFLGTCVTGDPRQQFAYRSDYSLVLAVTQSTTVPGTGGTCVSAASSTAVDFQPCDGGNAQKWSYNAIMGYQGLESDGSALSVRCLSGESPGTSGTALVLTSCSTGQAWVPDETVGAGAAGPAMQQLVNYDQYGRCLDITRAKVTATWLIAYPCKQDPSSPVRWNQRWLWDGSGTKQLQTVPSTTAYCLTTPASAGGFVVVQVCSADRADQRWTVNGDTGSRSTSYTIVDAEGRCLDLGPPQGSGSDLLWSSVVVNPCAGTFAQKWNAPPLVGVGGVLRERETTRD